MAEDATRDPNSDPAGDPDADFGRPAAVAKPPAYSAEIEGEATEIRDPSLEPPPPPDRPEPEFAEPPSPPLSPPQGRNSGSPFLSALAGALVGAAAALAAAWLYDPRSDQLRDLAARQSALETASSEQSAATKALETGLAKSAAVPGLEKRLAALESSSVNPDALLAAQSDATAAREAATKALALVGQAGPAGEGPAAAPDPRIGKLESDLSALDARIGKWEGDLSALSARIAAAPSPDPRIDKLESDLSALSARIADLTGLGDRVGKLEGALAAPKSEARVAAEISQEVDPASQAVAADALEQRLRAGEPFAAEWTALSRLGADAPSLAALKPYAETGAPTATALAASFAKVAPAMLAAIAPQSTGGAMDKLIDHMRKLVRVHAVGEVAGEEPDALVSQIQAALVRGQVAAAMSVYAHLPETARKVSADWAKTAEARAGADAAARTLRENAIAHLAAAKN
jgi:hypothetical protein